MSKTGILLLGLMLLPYSASADKCTLLGDRAVEIAQHRIRSYSKEHLLAACKTGDNDCKKIVLEAFDISPTRKKIYPSLLRARVELLCLQGKW